MTGPATPPRTNKNSPEHRRQLAELLRWIKANVLEVFRFGVVDGEKLPHVLSERDELALLLQSGGVNSNNFTEIYVSEDPADALVIPTADGALWIQAGFGLSQTGLWQASAGGTWEEIRKIRVVSSLPTPTVLDRGHFITLQAVSTEDTLHFCVREAAGTFAWKAVTLT